MTTKEKILKIIHNEFDLSDAGEQAANSIELLILQEKVDENKSILEMAKLHMDERAVIVIQSRISELNNQILKLNQ